MGNRYKIILSGNQLYKEIELTENSQKVKVGTGVDCDVRLRKELFFGQIELLLVNNGGQWAVICSDNLYLTTGDIRKLMTKQLSHGDSVVVKYQESDNDLFRLFFTLDFDYETRSYNRQINISGRDRIVIGGTRDCDILLRNQYVGNDRLALVKNQGRWFVVDDGTKYGVQVNGTRIQHNKQINNCDFFSIAGFSFYFISEQLFFGDSDQITVNGFSVKKIGEQASHFDYPNFIRNNRVQYCIPESEIEVQQPSPKPQKPKKNIWLSLIPSVFMLIMMVVIRGFMSNGGMFVIYSVCSMGIGVVMSVITYNLDKKDYRKEVAKREADYQQYIQNKRVLIEESRANELRIRNLIFESLQNSIQQVHLHGQRIFEKTAGDKDFLDIYLGVGDVTSTVPVKYTKQEFVDSEDPISQLPEKLEESYRVLHNAPIVSRFGQSSGVGVVGPKTTLRQVLKNMSLDLAIRHFYNEVKMYYMFDDSDTDAITWIKWLQHVQNDEIGIRNIMCDDESRKVLLENLYAILSSREAQKKEKDNVAFDTYYVVFVCDSKSIRKHPVSKYIENSNMYGFTFVFFEQYEEFLPMGCTEVIRLTDRDGVLLQSQNGDQQTTFTYSQVSDEEARNVALKLGAIWVDEVSLESELTKNITMFELLKIMAIDDLDLQDRWSKSEVYRSMAVPLGVKTKNEIVYLDLSDKANAHGPHGLVAGTTGSGKSELLQTYVLAVATLFHPYDVGFVMIDFKGGGMANQFKNLPHMMGAITNIDGREIDRSLLSIKAELVKRQALFAQAEVNHINDYIKLFKRGQVSHPLPHLIIIVDEFAELKAEHPDFMKELISAARIGRTLGVHLILATQKPAGVVDSQIWSNSKFKLCLKVQTKEDSNEVIKTPLAAEIVEPGRAYFQVGNNEIFELFQSAYSGAKVSEDGGDKSRTFDVFEVNPWGKRTLVYTNKRKGSSDGAKNQLQVIVDYVEEYCKNNGIKQLSGICLPSLRDVIKANELMPFDRSNTQDIVVPVGTYDDPEHQDQGNYCINLSESNSFVIGSAMMGKTTMLQTVLLQLMRNYTPQDVNLYIIDCGNMTLKVFENSNMVGGVVCAAEEDRVINLFKLLFRIIAERKKVFSDKGLGTHKAYKEAGYTDMPQIVLMIDNLAAFREYYDNLSDDFLALSREGTSVGISVIATATQTNAMNYKALSNYGTRISFVCNDTNEYMSLFDRCRIQPKEIPGRGLCVLDKRILEFQAALCVEGEKEYIRVENIRRAIQQSNAQYPTQMAMQIPFVPEILKKSVTKQEHPEIYKVPYMIPCGMDFSTVQFTYLDLIRVGSFGITGRAKSGKTNFVKNILDYIQDDIFRNMTKAYIFDDANMSFDFCKDYGCVEQYEMDETEIEDVMDTMLQEMKRRAALQRANKDVDPSKLFAEDPLLLMILENRKLIEHISKKADLLAKLKELLEGIAGLKICIIFSNVENATVGFNTPEVYKIVKANKRLFVFEDASEVKFVDVSIKQQKENAKPIKVGDGFMYFVNNMHRIRTIYVD